MLLRANNFEIEYRIMYREHVATKPYDDIGFMLNPAQGTTYDSTRYIGRAPRMGTLDLCVTVLQASMMALVESTLRVTRERVTVLEKRLAVVERELAARNSAPPQPTAAPAISVPRQQRGQVRELVALAGPQPPFWALGFVHELPSRTA